MFNIWIVAAGALALAATAVVARLARRRDSIDVSPGSSVPGVSEEWLSNARGQRDEGL